MSAIFGFYYNGKLKSTHHIGNGSPKVLGYDLFKTLWYAWPAEIMYIYKITTLVNASAKPDAVQLQQLKEQLMLENTDGYKFKKPLEELTFQDILSEITSDVFRYFQLIRHAGLRFMIDGLENVKTWGVSEWAYVYNLNQSRIEVWHNKTEQPQSQKLLPLDDLDRLNENFYLVHTMIHDQLDLGRNQFDLSGMDYAYEQVYGTT